MKFYLIQSHQIKSEIISFRHEFRKILCFLCCYRKYTPPNGNSANNNNNRIYTQNKRQPELEQGRDRITRRPTADEISSPSEESQAQSKDDATCVVGRSSSSNHTADKTAHKNSETRGQLVDCAIEEEDEEEVAKPFLSSSTAGGQASKAANRKLIDFSNRVDKGDADGLSNDKVWI